MERLTSQGVDREELIEWYLEQKEHELTSVEDLESEREIVAKALTKLVKDKYLMELRGAVGESIGDETMESSAANHTQVHYVVRKSDERSHHDWGHLAQNNFFLRP
jgi:DNA replication licensing factor MCM6